MTKISQQFCSSEGPVVMRTRVSKRHDIQSSSRASAVCYSYENSYERNCTIDFSTRRNVTVTRHRADS
eukprot:scaffold246182_cov20-Prasinocladus_malaysianus.AAC.1